MAEIRKNGGIQAIAFYLPQFHPIPENDRAWGEGFTEWTMVRRARPLFPGHHQPRVPKDGYYTLPDHDTQLHQAKLARAHGIFGFCYYHYWFGNGKKLLERPVEALLDWPDIGLPFCLSWANEPWTRRWDGGSGETIVHQEYGGRMDWEAHFAYLLPFFRDGRYITLDGKPLLLIYKPEDIPCLAEMLAHWQGLAKRAGLPGLCFIIQSPGWYFRPDYDPTGFAYQIRFQPFFSMVWGEKNLSLLKWTKAVYRAAKRFHGEALLRRMTEHHTRKQAIASQEQKRLDYDALWEITLRLPADPCLLHCACPDWDNTPRTKTGYMLLGASPEKFEQDLSALCQKILLEKGLPLLFLNAWNEWGEGAYLEPDERHGDACLQAVKKALQAAEKEETNHGIGGDPRL